MTIPSGPAVVQAYRAKTVAACQDGMQAAGLDPIVGRDPVKGVILGLIEVLLADAQSLGLSKADVLNLVASFWDCSFEDAA